MRNFSVNPYFPRVLFESAENAVAYLCKRKRVCVIQIACVLYLRTFLNSSFRKLDTEFRKFPGVHGKCLVCELCNEAPSMSELISLVPW